MKQFLVIVLFLFTNHFFAQSSLEYDSEFRFELIKPLAFGNNSIAKAHENRTGFGLTWSMLEYEKFRLGMETTLISFGVTDESKAGNFNRSNYSTFSGILSYDYEINEKFTLVPYLAVGGAKIKQKGEGRNSSQAGTEYKLGTSINYRSFYLKVSYAYAKLKIATIPEYEKFFGQVNQFQIALGIKF